MFTEMISAGLSYNQKAILYFFIYCLSVLGILALMYLQSLSALLVVRKTVGKKHFAPMNKPLIRKNTKRVFVVSTIAFFGTSLLLKLADLLNITLANNNNSVFESAVYFDFNIFVWFSILFAFLISVIGNYRFVLRKAMLSPKAKFLSAIVLAAITLPICRFITWKFLGL